MRFTWICKNKVGNLEVRQKPVEFSNEIHSRKYIITVE
jgi:hypothetical protein